MSSLSFSPCPQLPLGHGPHLPAVQLLLVLDLEFVLDVRIEEFLSFPTQVVAVSILGHFEAGRMHLDCRGDNFRECQGVLSPMVCSP